MRLVDLSFNKVSQPEKLKEACGLLRRLKIINLTGNAVAKKPEYRDGRSKLLPQVASFDPLNIKLQSVFKQYDTAGLDIEMESLQARENTLR